MSITESWSSRGVPWKTRAMSIIISGPATNVATIDKKNRESFATKSKSHELSHPSSNTRPQKSGLSLHNEFNTY